MSGANASQVVLTFLGTTNYEPARYHWANAPDGPEEVTTRLFPVAIAHWFPEARFKVAITEEVKNHPNWQTLQEEFQGVRKEQGQTALIDEVVIPEGRNENEIWQLFDNISDAVLDAEELIIDFTHSFRSIPLIAIMTALYVTEVGRLQGKPRVRHILYGAFEAAKRNNKKQELCPCCGTTIRRAPVLDFAGLLDIAKWLTAAHLFTETGDAREIADLAKDATGLEDVAEKLRTFSLSLELGRPRDVRENLEALDQSVEAVELALPGGRGPVEHILRSLPERYGILQGAPEPASALEELELDLRLIEWYIDAGKIAQACTVASEWLATWACGALGGDHRKRQDRGTATKRLSDSFKALENRRCFEKPSPSCEGEAVELDEEAVKQWGYSREKIKQWRDEIAHCAKGRTKDEIVPADELAGEIKGLPGELAKLLEILKAKR